VGHDSGLERYGHGGREMCPPVGGTDVAADAALFIPENC